MTRSESLPHDFTKHFSPAIHIPRRSINTCLVPLMGKPRSFNKFFSSGTFNLVMSPRSLILVDEKCVKCHRNLRYNVVEIEMVKFIP